MKVDEAWVSISEYLSGTDYDIWHSPLRPNEPLGCVGQYHFQMIREIASVEILYGGAVVARLTTTGQVPDDFLKGVAAAIHYGGERNA